MQHITVPLPDGLAPSVARRLAVEIEGRVTRRTGALVDATVTDLALTDQERRVIRSAIDLAITAVEFCGNGEAAVTGVFLSTDLAELRHRIDPDTRAARHAELTREQECAADAMAAEYGRSHVRHLSDGAVVVTGLTDDVERRSVCINRDGTERWRS
jgi:hypothetical protein